MVLKIHLRGFGIAGGGGGVALFGTLGHLVVTHRLNDSPFPR